MAEKFEELEKLYNVSLNSANSPQPKKSFLSVKCPKCDKKLKKKSVKEIVFQDTSGTNVSSEKANAFAAKVIKDAGMDPGVYGLSIEYFSCQCGYEYARSNVGPIEE